MAGGGFTQSASKASPDKPPQIWTRKQTDKVKQATNKQLEFWHITRIRGWPSMKATRESERERSYRAVVRWAVEMQRLDGLLEVSDEHGASVPIVVTTGIKPRS